MSLIKSVRESTKLLIFGQEQMDAGVIRIQQSVGPWSKTTWGEQMSVQIHF